MDGYIASVISISLICSFISFACPEDGGLSKLVSLVSATIIVIVIVSPIKSIISDNEIITGDIGDQVTADYDTNDVAARILSISVVNTVSQRFECKVEEIVVNTCESDSFQIETVEICLKDIVNVTEIKAYLEEQYNCEFIVRGYR